MNTGHWFNPCNYNVNELPYRILEELEYWDEDTANRFFYELAKYHDDPNIRYEIELEIIEELNRFAPAGHTVGYDDDANSFGCWAVEEEFVI